jgi:hypothetical protein
MRAGLAAFFGILLSGPELVNAFSVQRSSAAPKSRSPFWLSSRSIPTTRPSAIASRPVSSLYAADPLLDLDTVSLVVGQETYGLAIVCLGEAIWSFAQAPSVSHAKVLVPGVLAAILLVAVSGPMVTSGDASQVGTGLWIATAVSIGLGMSYIAR